ncbi:MAG TPA: FAD-dependent oxidoreductase [Bryobacteraceae bacterium]|nr:FAD-dependent oxidoreductase [Bryobacteraceae bacterium]
MLARRDLLRCAPALLVLPRRLAAARELRCDVAVIGGGTGGCAAALAALRNGMSVILTEETDWIGGQLTAQAVPPDEHPWIESFGSTALYRAYRRAVRAYYRRHYPLTAEARAREHLNPGDGLVSRLCHEPRVSLAVLEAMLAPYLGGGRLTVLLRHRPVRADTEGDSVRAVALRSLETGTERILQAAYFLDATEQGDLLPLTRTEYVTGFESRKQTGEPHAPEEAQPANIQAFTVCFAVDYRPGEDHTIDRPEEYTFWRDYVPRLRPPWPGKLLSWEMSHPVTLEVRPVTFDPELRPSPPGVLNLWLYRRIANRRNFAEGAYTSDITLVNWPQNDYWLGNLHEVSQEEAARHLRSAKQLSLSLLYWMQTEAPRPDGGLGWRGLRLRGDITGTEDGLAKYPYIRESRRIQAEFTVLEHHVGTEARMQATGKTREEVTAEVFRDSVGIGSYRIDLHPSSGGDNYIDISSLPFQIPLGSLIPKRVENLLAAAKNLGVTHITNGCYRLHPVEWNIGEAAGAVAAHALRTKNPPRRIRNTPKLLEEFQASLRSQGFELSWPRLSPR